MRSKIKFVAVVAPAIMLSGCVTHNFVPGPGMSMQTFAPDAANCRLFGRGNAPGATFGAAGSPKFVATAMAGAAIGSAIGSAIRQNADYNDCMEARGWLIADDVHPAILVNSPQLSMPVTASELPPTPQVTLLTPALSLAPLQTEKQESGQGFVIEPIQPVSKPALRRGLGIRTAEVTGMLAYSSRIDPPRGIVVMSVIRGKAASSAGLLAGDVLLTFGTAPLMTIDDLQRGLGDVVPNSVVEAQVWRNEHEMTVRIQF